MERSLSKNLSQGSFINHLKSIPISSLLNFGARFSTVHPDVSIFDAARVLHKGDIEVLILEKTPTFTITSASLTKAISFLYSEVYEKSIDKVDSLIRAFPFSFITPILGIQATTFDAIFSLAQPKINSIVVEKNENEFFVVNTRSILKFLLSERTPLKVALSMTLDEAALIEPRFLTVSSNTNIGEIAKALFLGKGKPVVLVANEEDFQGSLYNKSFVALLSNLLEKNESVGKKELLKILIEKLSSPFKSCKRKELQYKGSFSLAESRLSEESSLKSLIKVLMKGNQEGICVFESTEELAGVVTVKELLKFIVNFPYCDTNCRGMEIYCWKVRGFLHSQINLPIDSFELFSKFKESNRIKKFEGFCIRCEWDESNKGEGKGKGKEKFEEFLNFMLKLVLEDSARGFRESHFLNISGNCKCEVFSLSSSSNNNNNNDNNNIIDNNKKKEKEQIYEISIIKLLKEFIKHLRNINSQTPLEKEEIYKVFKKSIIPLNPSNLIPLFNQNDKENKIKTFCQFSEIFINSFNKKQNAIFYENISNLKKDENEKICYYFKFCSFNLIETLFKNQNNENKIIPESSKEEFEVLGKDLDFIETEETFKDLLKEFEENKITEININQTKKKVSLHSMLSFILKIFSFTEKIKIEKEILKNFDSNFNSFLNILKTKENGKEFLENSSIEKVSFIWNSIPKILDIDYKTHFLSLSSILKFLLDKEYFSSNYFTHSNLSLKRKNKKLIENNLNLNSISNEKIENIKNYTNDNKNNILWIKLKNKQLASISPIEILSFLIKEGKKFNPIKEILKKLQNTKILEKISLDEKSFLSDHFKLNGNQNSIYFKTVNLNYSFSSLFKHLIYCKNVVAFFEDKCGSVSKELFLKMCSESIFKNSNIPKNFLKYLVPQIRKEKKNFLSSFPLPFSIHLILKVLNEDEEVIRNLNSIRIGHLLHFVCERSFMSLKPSNTLYRFCRKAAVCNAETGVPVLAHNKRILCVLSAHGSLPIVSCLHENYNKRLEDLLDRRLLRMSSYDPRRSISPFSSPGVFSESEGEVVTSVGVSGNVVVKGLDELRNEFCELERNSEKVSQFCIDRCMQNFVIVEQKWSILKVLRVCAWSGADIVFVVNVKRRIFGKVSVRRLINYVFGEVIL